MLFEPHDAIGARHTPSINATTPFELDGNVSTQGETAFEKGTFDWESLFDTSGKTLASLPEGFTAADVVKLYLHRGSFETVLADEDREQDSDRWSSYTPSGQETWQILSQWIWNLRQELSQQWQPTSMRLTEFSPPSN